jgi:hypothetical protein
MWLGARNVGAVLESSARDSWLNDALLPPNVARIVFYTSSLKTSGCRP